MNRVQKGQPLRGNITAAGWNAAMDAAAAEAARKSSLGGDFMQTFRQAGIVLVKNASGSDRGRFDVLGIENVVFTPTDNLEQFQSRTVLSGVKPTVEDHTGRFVVLLEPTAVGGLGKAVVSGVCPAQVDVQSEDDEFADVADNDPSVLISGPAGSAAILWKEEGTGKKWAVVRLSNLGRLGTVVVKLTGNAEGGGKYDGKIQKKKCTAAAAGDLAMPEGMEDGEDCLFLNLEEDGLPTHWLCAGSTDGNAYVEGLIVGRTEEGSQGKPIVAGHGGRARVANPSSMGSASEGGEEPETDSWQRRQKSAGSMKGDCPLEVYVMTRPPVYKDDGQKALLVFMRKALIAADGKWDYIEAETRSTIFETCEHSDGSPPSCH